MTNLKLSRRSWRILAWLGLAAVMAVSLLPIEVPPQLDFWNSDKLVHISMYASLMLCFSQAYARQRWLVVAIGLASFGALVEFLQSFTPTRSASVLDELANVLGISIMLAIMSRRHRRVPLSE